MKLNVDIVVSLLLSIREVLDRGTPFTICEEYIEKFPLLVDYPYPKVEKTIIYCERHGLFDEHIIPCTENGLITITKITAKADTLFAHILEEVDIEDYIQKKKKLKFSDKALPALVSMPKIIKVVQNYLT